MLYTPTFTVRSGSITSQSNSETKMNQQNSISVFNWVALFSRHEWKTLF